MPVQRLLTSQRFPEKVWTDDADDKSLEQLANIASLPFIHHHVAAMPDVHVGIGATIGSVIATQGAITPAAVGVDIGYGMVAARLSLTANQIIWTKGRSRGSSIRSPATFRSAVSNMPMIGCWSTRFDRTSRDSRN